MDLGPEPRLIVTAGQEVACVAMVTSALPSVGRVGLEPTTGGL